MTSRSSVQAAPAFWRSLIAVPESYTHVAVATGGTLVVVAGQVAEDADDNLVGAGDLAAQALQAFANLGRCLAAAGAAPKQVARITIHVVDHRPSTWPTSPRPRIAGEKSDRRRS